LNFNAICFVGYKRCNSSASLPTVPLLHLQAIDAAVNPLHEGKRWSALTSKFYPEIRGVHTMWTLPITTSIVSSLVGKPIPHGTLFGLIPPTLAFTTVKGHSMPWPWNGATNLSPFERKLNGLNADGTPVLQDSKALVMA
jgi:hypothetical protein